MPNQHVRRNILRTVALCALLPSAAVLAKTGGCRHVANGNYQIGQTAEIFADIKHQPGDEVRNEKARGDGQHIQAACEEGDATFEGAYLVPLVENLVPLTVGGEPSGYGVELFVHELKDGSKNAFPSRYQLAFDSVADGVVWSNEADVQYIVRRMTGPMKYGKVDAREIAQQWSYEPGGAKTKAFRHMKIYELTIVRPACTIVAEDLDQTVDVGTYHVGNFATPDRATPWVKFSLRVEECQDPLGLVARVTFGTGSDADADNPQLFSLNGPKNVGLELADVDRNTMEPGKSARFNALGTGKEYVFNARMRETKPTVEGGKFNRPVKVLVEFM